MGCVPSQVAEAVLVQGRSNSQETAVTNKGLPDNTTKNEVDKHCVLSTSLPEYSAFKENDAFLCRKKPDLDSSGDCSASKSSTSLDSGVYIPEWEYTHIITERSSPGKVKLIEEEFSKFGEGCDLIVQGKSCSKKMNKNFVDENTASEMLRKEGLLVLPQLKSTGGIKFELVSAKCGKFYEVERTARHLPPLRLREHRQKKKKKQTSYQEIEKKLNLAEQRRKEQEEQKISKASLKQRTAPLDQSTEEKKKTLDKKMEIVSKSREKRIHAMQEKLKAKEMHANAVRRRKEMLENGILTM